MRKGTILFASTLLIFVLLAFIGFISLNLGVSRAYQDIIIYQDKRISLEILEPEQQRLGTVVMIHGILGSKKMLKPIATDFARHGWRTILIDQPGHGGTEGMYEFDSQDLEIAGKALIKVINQSIWFREAIYNYLREKLNPAEPVIFLGHSLGAFLAIIMGNETNAIFNAVATIAISPPYLPNITNATIPRNLLICIGKYDEFISIDSLKPYLNPEHPNQVKMNKIYGSFTNGSARELLVSPTSDHVLAPYDPIIIRESIIWAYRSLGYPPIRPVITSTFSSILLVLGALGGIVMVATLPIILAPSLGMISGGKRFPTLEQLKTVLVQTLIVWPILTIIFLIMFLAFIIGLAGTTGYIMPVLVIGYLFFATLALIVASSHIAGIPPSKIFRRIYVHMKSDPSRGLTLGLIEAIIFLLVLQTTLGQILFGFIPVTLGRWIMVAPSAFAIFAYFMFHEYMFRAQIQEIFGGRRKPAIFYSIGLSAASKLLVILFITVIIYIISPFQIVAIGGMIGMLFITFLTEGLAAASYYATREILPHALASAIVWAFIVTAIFPNVHLFLTL